MLAFNVAAHAAFCIMPLWVPGPHRFHAQFMATTNLIEKREIDELRERDLER